MEGASRLSTTLENRSFGPAIPTQSLLTIKYTLFLSRFLWPILLAFRS